MDRQLQVFLIWVNKSSPASPYQTPLDKKVKKIIQIVANRNQKKSLNPAGFFSQKTYTYRVNAMQS